MSKPAKNKAPELWSELRSSGSLLTGGRGVSSTCGLSSGEGGGPFLYPPSPALLPLLRRLFLIPPSPSVSRVPSALSPSPPLFSSLQARGRGLSTGRQPISPLCKAKFCKLRTLRCAMRGNAKGNCIHIDILDCMQRKPRPMMTTLGVGVGGRSAHERLRIPYSQNLQRRALRPI